MAYTTLYFLSRAKMEVVRNPHIFNCLQHLSRYALSPWSSGVGLGTGSGIGSGVGLGTGPGGH